MRSRWTALVIVLVLAGLAPRSSNAQAAPPQTPPRKSVPVSALGPARPNPMNPETFIPFSVGDSPACTDAGHRYSVTLEIRNTIGQLVAYPVIQGGVAGGQKIKSLQLTCVSGGFKAYWNGKYLDSQREAASGVYYYELAVDGHKNRKTLTVAK